MDTFFAPERTGTKATAAVTPEDVKPVLSNRKNRHAEEPCLLETVLAVDPGGTTGWAVFAFDPKVFVQPETKILENIAFWSCGQFSGRENDQVDGLIGIAEAWPDASVVVEDFLLRQFNMGRELLAPVRITAAFSYALRSTGTEGSRRGRGEGRKFYLQQPALAKSTITDARLRASGFYSPTIGTEHARDAVRHALTYARRKKAGVLYPSVS